ncbi:MAG TPA: hypothetical protein VE959_07020 [Bryobacteraceae bacterium]|nr:hypothetical protein [Bryobacteraceae bacterium]
MQLRVRLSPNIAAKHDVAGGWGIDFLATEHVPSKPLIRLIPPDDCRWPRRAATPP